MINILANDGISEKGREILEGAGFRVSASKVEQHELTEALASYDAILVRSATRITGEIIAACPGLRLVGRAGVGLDNIDVESAKSRGITVINTPDASTRSVAELVFAHLYNMARRLYDSNRTMPRSGGAEFNALKKKYADGGELAGKTLGIIGFGRIGQEVAKIAVGNGMKVLAADPLVPDALIEFHFPGVGPFTLKIRTVPAGEVLSGSDFITIHVPALGKPVISKQEFLQMKRGVGIVNTSRGGAVNELDLVEALDSGVVSCAGLDVFENEPALRTEILRHPRISLTPHIGASTREAQERIGTELAEKVVRFFKKN